jgi:hypothetical protein
MTAAMLSKRASVSSIVSGKKKWNRSSKIWFLGYRESGNAAEAVHEYARPVSAVA